MKRLLAFGLLCTAQCVFAGAFAIFPLDIFRNDRETRRVPDGVDIRWTVRLGGCTGSMLSPRYMLSAAHCGVAVGDRTTSGGCLALGCTRDLTVTRIVEHSEIFDSVIAEVSWSRIDSRWKQRYTPRVQITENQIELGRDDQATRLFTVGFPTDKNGAMLATGFAKEIRGNGMRYNIGIINGNSGGAVWTWDDYMLVSQTNNGPHNFGQPGWNNNDPENPRAWNGGPAIYKMYAQSKTLKEVYPTGRNYNVSFEGFLIRDDVMPPLDP